MRRQEPAISTPPLDPFALDPFAAFLELASIRFDATDLDQVLLRVAELAKQTIPRTGEVSVTLIHHEAPFTAAYTGEDALQLDESQYAPGHGPCLDVAQSSGTVVIADMASEGRWPHLTRRALDLGVRSSLSVALPVQESLVGALNLYSHTPGCYDAGAIELAQTFAGYAAVAIANVHLYESNASLAENMRKAMETRAVIEQAKGVLMAQLRCTSAEAFELLTVRSQESNRKLRDIAREIVTDIAASTEPGPG